MSDPVRRAVPPRVRAALRALRRTYGGRLLTQLPFTFFVIAGIFGVAASTNTLAHPISVPMMERWGFGMEELRSRHFYHLFLAPFQILRPYMAISITAAVLIFVGACERKLRTARTVIVFWVGHAAGYIGTLLILMLLNDGGMEWARHLIAQRDVGASNGAFACAGAFTVFLSDRMRKAIFGGFLLYLGLYLLLDQHIWDLQHLLAFSTGTLLGAIFHFVDRRRWPDVLPDARMSRRQRRELMWWAVLTLGWVNVTAAFLLPQHAALARLEAAIPVGAPFWPRHLMLAAGCALLLTASGIRRGQRVAWVVATSLAAISLALHVGAGIRPLEAILSLSFLLLLLSWRAQFRAPSDPPAARGSVKILAVTLGVVLLYGIAGFFVLRTHFVLFAGGFDLQIAVMRTLERVAFMDYNEIHATNRIAQWFLASIPVIGWGGMLLALTRALQVMIGPHRTLADTEIARRLLERHGASGTAYMTLWSGNSLFLFRDGTAYVAYRVVSGIAVALGDPIGPVGAADDCIDAFTEFATRHGWEPVFYAATRDRFNAYVRRDFAPLQIGEDAIIPLRGLEFKGKNWQNMRTAMNRATRDGVQFHLYEGGTVPAEIREQLVAISAEWTSKHALPSMGFTLGRTEDINDPGVMVGVAVGAQNRVHGFVDWLPMYERNGWVIDLMRRREDAMSGIMEFLIGVSMLSFKERGSDVASLAVAPLADLDREQSASLLQRALQQVFERSHEFYDFKSLFEFKDRFQPQWEPVYLMYRGVSTLPRASIAILRAHVPDLSLASAATLLGGSLAERLFSGE